MSPRVLRSAGWGTYDTPLLGSHLSTWSTAYYMGVHSNAIQSSDAVSTVAILSPGFPDTPGGVTDHTARLVQSWSDLGTTVRVLGDITESIDSLTSALDVNRIEALLIQYVPFLYGRRGISPLPRTLAECCQALGVRVTTYVHEPWVPPTRLPWLVLSPMQKRQLIRVLSVSDATVTAVPAWVHKLGESTQTVYVGSTLGDPPKQVVHEPPLHCPVVFSPFASGLRWDWINSAVQSLGVGLVVVGGDKKTAQKHPDMGRYADGAWDYRGRVTAQEALALLARAKLVLAPFVDGITGRRTSAMAALSCGSRLLTSTGHLCDRTIADGPAIAVNSSAGFSQTARKLWETEDTPSEKEERIAWFNAHMSPANLDSRLLNIVTSRAGR